MFAVWPSVYTSDKILKIFQFAGAPAANTQILGPGAGAWWKQGKKGGWSVSANYVARNGDNGNPEEGGIANGNSVGSGSVQLAYTGSNWNLTGLYTYTNRTSDPNRTSGGYGTPFAKTAYALAYNGSNAFGLSGYWQPLQSGWMPSISAGWGISSSSNFGGDKYASTGVNLTAQSWMVGLNWKDAFVKGNALGMAVGQPTFVTGGTEGRTPADGNYAWEWFYKFQVTDNIAVTPAIFWLSRPQGEFTGNGNTFNSFGYLVQTTFRF
jgi:hypothetical protein